MGSLYTLGEWTVSPGREQAFVSAWRELAEWSAANVDGNTWAKLLRDRDEPQRFISFGPWANDDAVAAYGTAATLPAPREAPKATLA